MKKIRMIYRWVIISVILQTAALAYLNYIYLPHRGSVKATIFEQSDTVGANWSIEIPNDASNPSVSYDGRYAAYFHGKKLVVMDVLKKKEIEAISDESDELTYYRWLPDRNMLIYASCSQIKKYNAVTITTYDVMSGEKRSYPEISELPLGSKVVEIELSPLTNIVYIKVKTGDERAKIYRFNIMDNRKLIMNTELGTVIKETNYSDNLIYQAGNYEINVRDGNKNSVYTLKFKGKMALLGVDSEDKVYVAELNNDGRAINIYYGKADTANVDSWEKVPLTGAVNPENFIISSGGAIYLLMPDENRVLAIGVGREYKYTDELIEITDNYIVTRDDRKLKLSIINRDIGL